MPKTSKSSPMKTILIIVAALIVGIGATFGFLYWSGGQQAETAKIVMQNQVKLGQLFVEAELAPEKIIKLADGKKMDEAKALGEKTLAQIDQILELNQVVIKNSKSPQKEIEVKRQELFQVQKGLTQSLIKLLDITDFKIGRAHV